MNNSLPDHFRDPLWRRALTAEERAQLDAWLAEHPEARDESIDEATLTAALERLSDAPVASNFTARVLAKLDRPAEAVGSRARPGLPWLRLSGWIPRMAVASLALGLAWFGWQQHRATERVEWVRSAAESVVVLTPSMVADFDPIQRLSAPAEDLELLLALQ